MKINYEGMEIEYKLIYKRRKTLKISVKPDCTVEVVAPVGVSEEEIKKIILKKSKWILDRRKYFEENPQAREIISYKSGATHRYLGKNYKLNVFSSKKNHVKLEENNIYIYSRYSTNEEYNKKLLYNWYREGAKIEFERVFQECFEKFTKYNFEKPTLSIRKMKRRWGSYTPYKNHVMLNLELIKEDRELIEYVIIHELCHIRHQNHRKEFYEFLSEILPLWKDREKRLKER